MCIQNFFAAYKFVLERSLVPALKRAIIIPSGFPSKCVWDWFTPKTHCILEGLGYPRAHMFCCIHSLQNWTHGARYYSFSYKYMLIKLVTLLGWAIPWCSLSQRRNSCASISWVIATSWPPQYPYSTPTRAHTRKVFFNAVSYNPLFLRSYFSQVSFVIRFPPAPWRYPTITAQCEFAPRDFWLWDRRTLPVWCHWCCLSSFWQNADFS